MTQLPNLLVISHRYASFQKDPFDLMSPYFNQVFVLVRSNPIAEISKYISIPSLQSFNLSSKIDLTNKPPNIQVTETPILYFPFDSQYKNLGGKHFKIVDNEIFKNKYKFDLVHSHFTWSSGYVGAKIKEKYSVPFVVTTHGYDIYDLPFRDKEWKEKIEYIFNSADYIITVSNQNLESVRKLNVKTPVEVIPNGFRTDYFYPRDSEECRKILGLPLNKKIILNVGGLFEVKGQSYLIDAMREIVKHRNDVFCVIVGGGKLKNKLEKKIKSLELQDFVKLSGEKPHSEISIWINSCDVFVLPSLNEGNPTVMFECLGCGKPFIGTKVGGISEIIYSKEYGLLVEPANLKDLVENIELALNSEWNQSEIAKYGEQFDWNHIIKRILNVYEQIK